MLFARPVRTRSLPTILLWALATCLLAACTSSKKVPNPYQKFSPDQLKQEIDIVWQTYQQVHPSYNWFTPGDSVDARFERVRSSLTDSLTEMEFRLRLSYAAAAIRCGHTSVLAPKAVAKAANKKKNVYFPLQTRVWGSDSMIVTANVGTPRDSITRGTIVTSIDNVPVATIIRQMQQYISVDGYNNKFAEAAITGSFGARFRWLYGLGNVYKIGYIDSLGHTQMATVRNPKPDTANKSDNAFTAPKTTNKSTTTPFYGYLKIDTATKTAYLRLNTFSGSQVQRFIRKSFATIAEQKPSNLILDLRENGGGRIQYSVLLGRYLAHQPFLVADSVSATSFKFPHARYVQASWFYKLFGWMLVHKKEDGRLHYGTMERQRHKPKKKNHYNGPLYVITGGRSFSASILLLQYLRDRPQLIKVGEETGGGARGNSAVMTPNITLPHTGIRARLPLFRLVTDASLPNNGRGVLPDVLVPYNSADIRRGIDTQVKAVMKLIEEKAKTATKQ